MTARRNAAASVKQRLLNLARKRGEEFNLVLVRYGIERLLYRLSRSEHAWDFVLKGAMLFHLWTAAPHRPTPDVDLLGRGAPEPADFPVLLDQPAPRLSVYRRETVVAEKFQAMVDLGLANSRMKDFFDLRFLAATFEFDGSELARAIEATFVRRRTPVPQGANGSHGRLRRRRGQADPVARFSAPVRPRSRGP